MALPTSNEAKAFYRCALMRCDDAAILLNAGQTTGAVYLAGYAVECVLKALLLSRVTAARRTEILATFRGSRAHDFEWLRSRYLMEGGARFPREITEALTLVGVWSTDLRYLPRNLKTHEAAPFIEAAKLIVNWVEERRF